MKKISCILFGVFLFLYCDNPVNINPAGPSSTTIPELTEPSKPPRVDLPADLGDLRGATSFGAALLSEYELLAYVNHLQSNGHNFARTGSSTRGWCGGKSYIDECCGPEPGTQEWTENLERLLDVTSRIPNFYVQLIPTFTHKNNLRKAWEVLEMTVAIQQAGSPDDPRPYMHVIWDTVNEWKHPISVLTMGDVISMTRRLQETGLPVGVDYGGGREDPWEGYYPPEILPYVDYISFHPPRNHWENGKCEFRRPSRARLRKVISSYSKPVFIEEPECYVSNSNKAYYDIGRGGLFVNCGGGTDRVRQRGTQEYMDDTEAGGGVWVTHTVDGFLCTELGFLPR